MLKLLNTREAHGGTMVTSKGTGRRQQLTPDEQATIDVLLSALEPFFELRATMPLQYVKAFLLVALEEGQGVTEYGRKAGVSQSVMSRYLLDIGERNRYMDEGFDLVTQRPDPMELRKHQVMLTPKGVGLAHRIIRALRRVK